MEHEKISQLHGQIETLREDTLDIRCKMIKLQFPHDVIVHLEYAASALVNAQYALEDSMEVHYEQNNSCVRPASRR